MIQTEDEASNLLGMSHFGFVKIEREIVDEKSGIEIYSIYWLIIITAYHLSKMY
jgi:hypothetical protein